MPVTAQQMVDALRNVMVKNPALKSITVDGQTTTFNSLSELQAALSYWEARAAKESGKRPFFRRVNQNGWNG